MQIVQESPIIQELKNIWMEEGREEGREAALSIFRGMIAFRFDVAEDHFDNLLAQFSLSELAQLRNSLFDARSISEFEQALEQLAQTHQNESSKVKH